MVVTEEEFYTITGEKINRQKLVQKMIDSFNKKYPDTQITDFNEGSEIRDILESIAVDIYHMEKNDTDLLRACFLPTSYGQYLDLFGEELGVSRDYGASSWGTVTFSIPETITEEILIPFGTKLASSTTGLNYITNLDASIMPGETSVTVPAYSQVAGKNTNAEANTVTVFRDEKTYNALSVTNTDAFSGGRDVETDDEYRNRLINAKTSDGFGSKNYYIGLGESVEGVHDVIIVNATGYIGKVIVNGKTKPVSDELLGKVTAVYTDEMNLIYNHSFICAKVEYTTAPLEITMTVTDEISEDTINEALNVLFDGGEFNGASITGMKINESLTSYLIMQTIEMIPGVLQVTSMTSNSSSFNILTPETNKVLKLGAVTITQNVAG